MLLDSIHISDTTVTFLDENKPVSCDNRSESSFSALCSNDTFVADPIEKAIAEMTRRPRERDSRSGSLPAAYLFPDAAPVAEQPYGWVVVCAVFGIHVIVDGITYSWYGILEKPILDKFQAQGAAHVDTGLIMSILLGVTYGCGPVASQICLKFGLRPVAIFGSCLACAGFILSMVAGAIWQLHLTLGALVGLGFGFMYLPAIVSVASWFEEHRTLATSLAVCGSGIGTFVFPPLITYLKDEFGVSGTFLILGGISLNGIVFAALLRTPPRHEADRKLKALRRAAAKVCETPSICDELRHWCAENIDWRLFKSWKFWIYCCSSFLGGISCYIPYMYLTEWAKQKTGTDELHASLLVSCIGIANIFGRLGAGIHSLAEKFCIHELVIYSLCCILSGIATSVTALLWDFVGFAVYSSVFGFCGGIIVALQSVVLTDIVGIARISHAFGILLFVQGVATLLGPPLAGHMVDTHQNSYEISFIVTGIVMALSGVVLVVLPLTKMILKVCK